jgi:hypothetical protein
MVVGLAISIAVSWFVPFPYSLGIMVPAFLAMAYLVRWQAMKKMGDNTAFGWSSALRAGQAPAKLEYYCMVCGTKHDLQSCPKCGSRAVRAG